MSEEVVSHVSSTSVSITLNAKSLGLDAFIKFEETVEFPDGASEVDALLKRDNMAALIADQLLAVIRDTSATIKAAVPALPVASGPLPVAPAGAYQGQPAPSGAGAAAVAAVANGAVAGGDWRSAPDRFDSTKSVRYLSTVSYTADQMKIAAAGWLASAGFNAVNFDIWDERRDAESGKAISSVCNIKVKKDLLSLVPHDVVQTNTGGVKAVARAKFNHDGSLFFYWSKDAEAAIKYGAFAPLAEAVANNEEQF
jgi:hypothetical protein